MFLAPLASHWYLSGVYLCMHRYVLVSTDSIVTHPRFRHSSADCRPVVSETRRRRILHSFEFGCYFSTDNIPSSSENRLFSWQYLLLETDVFRSASLWRASHSGVTACTTPTSAYQRRPRNGTILLSDHGHNWNWLWCWKILFGLSRSGGCKSCILEAKSIINKQ